MTICNYFPGVLKLVLAKNNYSLTLKNLSYLLSNSDWSEEQKDKILMDRNAF